MRKSRQEGIKIKIRNTHILNCSNVILMAVGQKDLKTFLLKLKEECKNLICFSVLKRKEKKQQLNLCQQLMSTQSKQVVLKQKLESSQNNFFYRSGDNSCKNRCSQLEKKAMTDLYEILKCILITVTTKVCIAKTVVFSVIIYGQTIRQAKGKKN